MANNDQIIERESDLEIVSDGSRYMGVPRRRHPYRDPTPPTVDSWEADEAYAEFEMRPTVELRRVDPCTCASFLEALDLHILYVTDAGATVLKPLVLKDAVTPAMAMRHCPFDGRLMDENAPDIKPWTSDNETPAVCCTPMRAAWMSGRIVFRHGESLARLVGPDDDAPFVHCPWCKALSPETAKVLAKSGLI